MSIRVEDLSFAYGTHAVLRQVCFRADKGQLVAVLGPNGAGKSTLFRCILGLLHYDQGRIYIDDTDVRTLPPREAAHRVAYIPQLHGQVFSYSVEDMVLMGTAHALAPWASPKKKERAAAREAMERIGIDRLEAREFTQLSGGEQQLVLIARALAQQAETLLMDEPTASLDYGNQTRVLSCARTLASQGYTVLLSTHNPQHALFCADTALALHEGAVMAMGRPEEVVTPELIRHLYGVEADVLQTQYGPLIAQKT